jgi:S-methylmethionine-dependent homocysteine/selenocysteine methylase
MARYRNALPQLDGGLFVTDGGIETTLIFHEGLELPDFAAFHLLKTREGEAALRKYFRAYAEIAKRFSAGLILESATWRASADWGKRLGYSREELAEANRRSIRLLEALRSEYETARTPVVISGCVGPRGDGYVPNRAMSESDAEAYHREQIETFAGTAADMICAITMNYAEEAGGVARAARGSGMPVAISFTVETDGRLPTGQPLKDAIAQVDGATTSYPSYYMINCAHPAHFEGALAAGEPWVGRVRGLRANASRKSHAQLNESAELDTGNPEELGRDHARLKSALEHLNVFGGCCGTDGRHVEAIAKACAPFFRSA